MKVEAIDYPEFATKPMYVTKSKIFREELSGGSVAHSCRIYVDCVCGCNDHTARIVFDKELRRSSEDPNKLCIVTNDVYFEFNVTKAIDPSSNEPLGYIKERTVLDRLFEPLNRVYKRWQAAWRLIRGKEVYFSSDILMDYDSARQMANSILETLKVMDEAR